jgi:DNA-binding MarR family transcriptional regulator
VSALTVGKIIVRKQRQVSRKGLVARLESLKSEVDELQQDIARFDPTDLEVTADVIDGILRARLRRSEFFQGDLFADPAWDILLDLYRRDLAEPGAFTSISEILHPPGVGTTTVLRWLGKLEAQGYLKRTSDARDKRRTLVGLSRSAVSLMNRYFAASDPLPV